MTTITTKRPTIKDVKTIEITTRHWTDSYGNTYFAGDVELNGKVIHEETFCYGYGDHAMMVMVEKCVKTGLLPRMKDKEVTWRYLDRVAGRKNWTQTDTQVSRKKYL